MKSPPRDQFFRTQNGSQVIGFGKVALDWLRRAGHHLRHPYRLVELCFERSQARSAAGVGIRQSGVRVHDQMQLARQVVNHRKFFALQQQDVRAMQLIRRARGLQLLLDITHHVVAKVTRQAAAKPGQTRTQRDFKTALVVGNKVQRIAV